MYMHMYRKGKSDARRVPVALTSTNPVENPFKPHRGQLIVALTFLRQLTVTSLTLLSHPQGSWHRVVMLI